MATEEKAKGNGKTEEVQTLVVSGVEVVERAAQLETLLAAEGVECDPLTWLACISLGVSRLGTAATRDEIVGVVDTLLGYKSPLAL